MQNNQNNAHFKYAGHIIRYKLWFLSKKEGIIIATINLQAIEDSFVDSFRPNVNFGSSPELLVGKLVDGVLYRALLKFDLTSIPSGVSITSAQLTLHMNFDYSGTGAIAAITPYAVAGSWNGATLTWPNQPAVNNAIAGTATSVTRPGLYTWNVLNLVNLWLTGSLANNGLELKTGESVILEAKNFASNAGAQKPLLTIAYGTGLRPGEVTITGHAAVPGHGHVITGDSIQYTATRDTFQAGGSFTVNNISANTAIIAVQYSNDGVNYAEESPVGSFPNSSRILPSPAGARFQRIAYQSLIPGHPATLAIN